MIQELLCCALLAFTIAFVLIPEIIKIAHNYQIHDLPNARKVHSQRIPRFGGLAIFIGLIITTLLWSFWRSELFNLPLLAAATGIVIVGFRDDFLPLRASIKLLAQVAGAFIIIFFGDIRLNSLHGLLGIHELPVYVAYPVSIFTVVVITNAFNLIDGINGLAGSVAILVFGTYGYWFYINNDIATAALCFGVIGGTLAFLFFNYQSQIFMGDCGSLLLGFLAATVTIKFLSDNAQLPPSAAHYFASPVMFVSCLLAFPLFDTIRVFVLRTASGISPFTPDRNHIHHLLIGMNLPHAVATTIILSVNALFIIAALLLQGYDDNLLVAGGIFVAWLLTRFLKKRSVKFASRQLRNLSPHVASATNNHLPPMKEKISESL
ncbi:MAG: MraY family glycosyltransferase [Cytophagales bacterium]|nr:undecaprenyl/decaprenyl-phosphate alpha-N-acetylglucosaminyl 1-phosphate transferase [Bernardetiaceae bacterium]MDW8205364.1 MraY family glycosyltransferase [Cytophagales bacterium]